MVKKEENIIYQDDTGYISGSLQQDGYYWIDEFVIFPEFRGKGLSKELATHLPLKSRLLAYPLKGSTLSKNDLIKFYISLGFEIMPEDKYGNTIMQRG